jgi:hypothetical protein
MAAEKKQMDMVVHQNPGQDSGAGLFNQLRDARKKIFSVRIIPKDILAFDSMDHYMVKGSRGI